MVDWKFVSAITLLLVVCLGEFPVLGEGETADIATDLPYSVQNFSDGVNSKIDDSVESIKKIFQSAKRSSHHRIRRSWWSDNEDWIVPVAAAVLLVRDVSSAKSTFAETAKRTVPETDANLDAVNDSIDFLKTIANTASKAIEFQENQ